MRFRHALPIAAVALLIALAAGLAVAALHRPGGTRVSLGTRPVSAQAELSPRDPQFGDTVVATIDVFADPHRVDPHSVAVTTGFGPYRVISDSRTVHKVGGVSITHFERRLRCLDAGCVPAGDSMTLHFLPPRVSYRGSAGPETLVVAWPALRVHSRLARTDLRHPMLQVPAAQLAAAHYRLPPRATGYALLSLAALLALGGAALLLGVALRREPADRRTGEPLERILGELGVASSNGDPARRRHALEELARELEPLNEPLSAESRVLAWAPQEPGADAISDLTSRVRTVVWR